MGLLSAIKSALRFPAWGGSGVMRGGISDFVAWSGTQPYNYAEAAGPLHRNGVVMACAAWLMRHFPEPPVQVVKEDSDGEENEVPKHPLTLAFRRPNNFYGSDCLWQRVIFDRALHGQAFMFKERNASGDIIALYHVPQHRIIPQWDSSGKQFIDHYLFTVDARQDTIPTKDLVHFRFAGDPDHERYGLATLSGGMREVATLNEGSNYRAAILKRMGVPSHLLQGKDPLKPITSEQASKLHSLWMDRVCGGQRGGVLIPNFPLEALKVGMSPQELDIGNMTFEAADLVCSLFGLSSMVVGISSGGEHKTYANYGEAREAATEGGLVPAWKQIAQELTLQLLPDYSGDEEECVEFDLTNVRALQEDESALWERIDRAVNTGWIQVNEARSKVNLPPVKGGDVFMLAKGNTLIGADGEPVGGVPPLDGFEGGLLTRNEARKMIGKPPVKDEPQPAQPGQPGQGQPFGGGQGELPAPNGNGNGATPQPAGAFPGG